MISGVQLSGYYVTALNYQQHEKITIIGSPVAHQLAEQSKNMAESLL